MTLELRLYENPQMITTVKPGQIIEALPGTKATHTVYSQKDPIQDNPTNVFGYVRGMSREDYITIKQGDMVVERILPFGGYHDAEIALTNRPLQFWGPDNIETYLVIGELQLLPEEKLEDQFHPQLIADSVTLSTDKREVVRDQLLAFIASRKRKEYVFQTPSGDSYSLNEIVLSLREKR